MPNHDPLPPLPPPPPQPPQVLMDELYCHHHHHNHHSSMDIELRNELVFNVDNPYNTTSGHNDNGYTLPGSGNGSLFSSGGDEREGSGGGIYPDDGTITESFFEDGVMEFSREMGSIGRGRNRKESKNLAIDRVRRQQLNDKFFTLRNLIPNPTQNDKASIVGDAIGYINELLRTVDELKLLVEKKRCGRERINRHKTEQDGGAAGDDESCNIKPLGEPHDQSCNNGSLRSSWLQRKSKYTEVDIRIIEDEVTIKLVQRKKINLLLFVSRLLDELQLDLHHVAGGQIGNSYSFLFNTKMYEGSCLYASAIAGKFIEVAFGTQTGRDGTGQDMTERDGMGRNGCSVLRLVRPGRNRTIVPFCVW